MKNIIMNELLGYLEDRINIISSHPHIRERSKQQKCKELRLVIKKINKISSYKEHK